MTEVRKGAGEKPRVLVISGPTASGKSGLAVRLAGRRNGEIISADSMQVYRGMDIGTAKIRPEEMQGIPHHMIDIYDPAETCSVADYKEAASRCLQEILERGHLPVIVGGTGFYIHALLYDTDFSGQEDTERIREELEKIRQTRGPEVLWQMLQASDPASAAAIHPNNVKRVMRALEFLHTTGGRISEHNEEQRKKESPYDFIYLAIRRDRQELYRDIDRRVDLMMEEGLAEEVRRLVQAGCRPDMVSMQAIGYKQLLAWMDGRCSLEEAVDAVKKESRHYAKRQMTWLRREQNITWIDGPSLEEAESVMEKLWK